MQAEKFPLRRCKLASWWDAVVQKWDGGGFRLCCIPAFQLRGWLGGVLMGTEPPLQQEGWGGGGPGPLVF